MRAGSGTKVVVVCMANLCRSPMAQAVLDGMARSRALPHPLELDSAGVRVALPGARPDPRAAAALARRGYAAPRCRSRQLVGADFERFDLLLAMDRDNLAELRRLAPPERHAKLHLYLDFAPDWRGHDVPDPYFGSAAGFERVLDLCEAGARGLLDTLAQSA